MSETKLKEDAGGRCAPAPGSAWPDIGLDPLKHRDEVKGGVEGAKERLKQALCIQQTKVPDQAALVWRIDISRVLDELTVMTARWKHHQEHLPPNAKVSDGWPSCNSRIAKQRDGPAIRSTES